MRKLVFKLVSNVPMNSTQPRNVAITTHMGSSLMIRANQPEVLDVTNDPMSDNELLGWYKSRYVGMGMGISILKDVESKPVVTQEEKVVESTVSFNETVKVEELPKEEIKEDLVVPQEECKIAKVEPKCSSEDVVSKMSYQEMLAFADEHGIEIKSGRGRSEACVKKTLIAWMDEHK